MRSLFANSTRSKILNFKTDYNPFIHMGGVKGAEVKEGIISIIGLIGAGDMFFGGGGVTANEIQDRINTYRDSGVQTLVVQISSYGGDVDEGETIYSLLRNAKGTGSINKIRVEILGQAYSIASVIAMAGDEILVDKEVSRWMIHPAWTPFAQGNAEKLREIAEDLDKRSDQIFEYYMKRTGAEKNRSELRKLFDNEDEFDGQKAIDLGLADGFISNESSKNSARTYASIFNYYKILEKMKNEKPNNGNDQPKWVKDMMAALDKIGNGIGKMTKKLNGVVNGSAKADDGTDFYFEGENLEAVKVDSVLYSDSEMTKVIEKGELTLNKTVYKIEAGKVASIEPVKEDTPPAPPADSKEVTELKAALKKEQDEKAALKTELDGLKTSLDEVKGMLTGKGKNQFAGNKKNVFTKREEVIDENDDDEDPLPTTASGVMSRIANKHKQSGGAARFQN